MQTVIEPFSYLRNEKEKRVFLVADVLSPELGQTDDCTVLLLEWGKGRNQGIKTTVRDVLTLLQTGALTTFNPKTIL